MAESPFEIHYSPGKELILKVKSPMVSELIPEDVRQHYWKARKEMMMALRGILDKAIEKVDEKSKPKASRKKKKTKIDIE